MPKVRGVAEIPPEDLRRATDEIHDLIATALPRAFVSEVSWKLIAAGFIARIDSILESLTLLVERGQRADAMVMTRVLFDHVATYCWLAIDPDENVPVWRQWDDSRLLALHRDATKYGVEVLTPTELEKIGKPAKPEAMPAITNAVDEYWSEHSKAFRPPSEGAPGILTFRGFYTSIFRRSSKMVHPSIDSVERHLRDHGSQILVTTDEQPFDPPDTPALAISIVAFALIVNGIRLGWPDEKLVRRTTESLLHELE